MFGDLALNLAASVIYDFGKAIATAAQKTEALQHARKGILDTHLHDFPDRYLEALVELRFEAKTREVLDCFRDERVMQAFYAYYYGPAGAQGDDKAHAVALNQCVAFLRQQYPETPTGIDMHAEVTYFWQVFRQKVQESRTVKEVEINQKLDELKAAAADAGQLLHALNNWLRARKAERIEIGGDTFATESAPAQARLSQKADKLYNIGHIGEAYFDGTHYHYHGGAPIPRYLTDPPLRTEMFLGREPEMQYIENQFFTQKDKLLLLVNGEGGIGKTTLAAHYFHRQAARYAHLAWLFADHDIADALLRLALPLGLRFEPTLTSEARMPLLIAALANLQGPCLLVLDNTNDEAALRKVWGYLRRLPNVHLLLSTRIPAFEGAETLPVEGLPEHLALQLFESYYQPLDEQERGLFRAIRRAVGHNTLVLELLSKNLRQINRLRQKYSLADLLADLQQRGFLQLTHSAEVGVDYQSKGGALRREKPEAILAAMYDISPLDPAETQVLALFSVLPAENIALEEVEALLPDASELDNTLLALHQKGWLDFEQAETAFKCNPVVQQVARQKIPDLWNKCRGAVSLLVDKLDYDVLHHDNYHPAARHAQLAEAVIGAMAQDEYLLALLCERVGNFYTETGDLAKALAFYEKCRDRAETLCQVQPEEPYHKNVLAISYEKLGETHRSLGNLDEALSFFEKDIELSKELYASYPQHVDFKNGLAISYSKLGSTHSSLGKLDEALSFFEEYNRLEKELYASYPQNVSFKNVLAISYEKLGSTHSSLGKLDEALSFFEEYNRLEKELYASYPQNVDFKNVLAISYEKLGSTHSSLGNLDEALSFFEEYNRLKKELYASYPQHVSFKNGLAISYEKLGETHSSLGKLDEALSFFEEYNRLEKELYASYPQNVDFKNNLATSWLFLGQLYQNQLKDPDKAHACIRQGYDLYVELVRDFPDHPAFKGNYAWARKQLGITP